MLYRDPSPARGPACFENRGFSPILAATVLKALRELPDDLLATLNALVTVSCTTAFTGLENPPGPHAVPPTVDRGTWIHGSRGLPHPVSTDAALGAGDG